MITKTLKNKKRFSLYLKISLIILGIIFISLITYKIYFNKESLKHNFQDIKKQNEICNQILISTPFSIYKNYYITTTNNDSYMILKISKKEYNKLMKYDFKDKYTIKGMSKKLDNETQNKIKLLINDGKSEFKGNILYLDSNYSEDINTVLIFIIILIIVNTFLLIINNMFLKTINIDENILKKYDKDKYTKYGKLYISNNYIFLKNTFEIININNIIVMYEKNDFIYLVTEYNEMYKFKNSNNYDLFDVISSKNKDIIIGINNDIKKQIKKKYNITLKEV